MSYKIAGVNWNEDGTIATEPLEVLEKIKNAPTIYVGCASDVYTRYSHECKIIEDALEQLEMEHTLRIRLENINYDLTRVLQIVKAKPFAVCELTTLFKSKPSVSYDGLDNEVFKIVFSKEEFDLLKTYLGE